MELITIMFVYLRANTIHWYQIWFYNRKGFKLLIYKWRYCDNSWIYWLNFIFLNSISPLHLSWLMGFVKGWGQKKSREFAFLKEEMFQFVTFETFYQHFFLPQSWKLVCLLSNIRQVVEFKVYVMPFFSWKVNLYFSSIELVFGAYQIFIFFVIFLKISSGYYWVC